MNNKKWGILFISTAVLIFAVDILSATVRLPFISIGFGLKKLAVLILAFAILAAGLEFFFGFVQKVKTAVYGVFSNLNELKLVRWIGWAVVGVVGLSLLILHIRLIVYPYQMEYREGAIVLTTQGLLNGINPWALENNPVYINVYGFVYNFLVIPFALILGNKVWIYRLISFLAVLGQIGLISLVLRRKGVAWIWIAFAGVFMWLGQFFSVNSLARPDALGELFFLLTLFVPLIDEFSSKSLILSGLFGLLGFYTKPYFIIGIPIISAFVFLFTSKKRAILYAGGSFLAFVLTGVIVNKVYESYFLNVIFSHIEGFSNNLGYLALQNIKFIDDYWGLLIIGGLLAVIFIIRNFKRRNILRFSIKSFQEPFIHAKLGLNLFALLITSGLIYFVMGKHGGSYMSYYYQLLTPFLLILVFENLQNYPIIRGAAIILVGINLLTYGFGILKSDLKPYETNSWKQLTYYLNNSRSILNTPITTLELVYRDIPVVNSGQSEYFSIPETSSIFYPDLQRIAQVNNQYKTGINNLIEQKYYNFIFTDSMQFAQEAVGSSNYHKINTITFNMAHTDQIWTMEILAPSETR